MRTRKEDVFSAYRMWQSVAIGSGIGMVVAALGLLLAAVVMTLVDLPEAAISPLSVAALGLGCLVAGLVAARRFRKRGWLLGMVCGLLIFLITWIAGLLSIGNLQLGFAMFKLAVSVLCGSIGGVLGVGR